MEHIGQSKQKAKTALKKNQMKDLRKRALSGTSSSESEMRASSPAGSKSCFFIWSLIKRSLNPARRPLVASGAFSCKV
jgi:hypothetical protein